MLRFGFLSRGSNLPRAGLLFDTPNRYPFVDRVGANTRTLYGLQYIHLAGATDFTNAAIVGTETVTSQPAGTAAITVAAGKLTIGAGDLWTFTLSNGSTYEFGTILTATTGVVFDTSGNGRHLLFSVADTSVVCLSGREKGSNWPDEEGLAASDGRSLGDDWLSGAAKWLRKSTAVGPTLNSNYNFTSWSGDNPTSWVVLNENGANYITQVSEGLRIVSDNTAVIALRSTTTLSTTKTYEMEVNIISITGTITLFTSDFTTPGIKKIRIVPNYGYIQISKGGALDATIGYIKVGEVTEYISDSYSELSVAITGDSIAAGSNTSTPYFPPIYGNGTGNIDSEPAHRMLNFSSNFTYENHALGSRDYAWVASAGGLSAAQSGANAIIIHCGVNDIIAGRTWGQIEANLNTIRAFVLPSQRLFIDEILPWTPGSDTDALATRNINTSLAAWCAANNAILILSHNAMGEVRSSTGHIDNLKVEYSYDGLHLSQDGVDALALIWVNAIVANIGGDINSLDGEKFFLSPGSAKQNITRTSGSSTTITDEDTYTLPDSHTFRTAVGWTWGVDHWGYNADGIPKEILGSVIKENGDGLRWYVGMKGLALYSVDQTYNDAKIKKYLKVPA